MPPDPGLSKPQDLQHFQTQNTQHPQPQNFQCSWSQTFDVPDRYADQLRLHREWDKMERIINKYGLDCFSDSEVDSRSDEGEKYRYEHKYETLI